MFEVVLFTESVKCSGQQQVVCGTTNNNKRLKTDDVLMFFCALHCEILQMKFSIVVTQLILSWIISKLYTKENNMVFVFIKTSFIPYITDCIVDRLLPVAPTTC